MPLAMQPFSAKALVITVIASAMPWTAFAQKPPSAAASQKPAAQTQAPKPAPYDGQLARLSEILGALQYIETICKNAKQNDWRADMAAFLQVETNGEAQRQEKITAAFNRGYRGFAATYAACTSNAKQAELAYRNEGATLAQEITSRFGN